MTNYKMLLQYDGSRYDGWQRMGNDQTEHTILYKLQEVLKKMTGQEIDIFCGCRTERGVHALEQTVNFKLEKAMQPIELKNYFNRYLPRDIAVLYVGEVDERFHSQLLARGKTYEYRLDIRNVADVFTRKYSYHTFSKPDFEAMRQAAGYFLGEHDFCHFTTARRSKTTVRTILGITIEEGEETAVITITADDFLHNMAKLMIGVLLDVGNKTRKPEYVQNLLDGSTDAVMSLPAESYGLFLKKVLY